MTGDGSVRFWSSRPVVIVVLLLASIATLGAPAAIVGMTYATVQRPLTGVVASLTVLVTAYLNRRLYLADPDNCCRRIVYAGIVSGMVGEALTYWIFGLPAGAPVSPPWLALFVTGIGGAIGVGFGAAALILISGLFIARTVPTLARAAFGRRA